MNYAQVIDSARNMQLNQDQVDNDGERDGQIDINDPNVVQAVDEANDTNEASADSLNHLINGTREEQ